MTSFFQTAILILCRPRTEKMTNFFTDFSNLPPRASYSYRGASLAHKRASYAHRRASVTYRGASYSYRGVSLMWPPMPTESPIPTEGLLHPEGHHTSTKGPPSYTERPPTAIKGCPLPTEKLRTSCTCRVSSCSYKGGASST